MKKNSGAEDLDLIEKAKKGDKHAFSILVRKYEPVVAATVIGMLGPGEDADDTGQNVFIRFYNSLDKFRGESALGTYLTRIAINLSLNELKRRKRQQLLFFKPTENKTEYDFSDQSNNEAAKDSKELVDRALQNLEPKFRTVVVLRMIQGYSTQETAKILKIPLGTVLSRLSRAQEKLKIELEKLMT